MTTFVSSITNKIARTSLAIACGMAILGGAAYGNGTTAQRHEQEMNQGKDHQLAGDATSLAAAPSDSQLLGARAKKHIDEMNKGKDHYAAWDAIRTGAAGDSQDLQAKAKKHLAEMNNGKDHYAAWDATRR